MLIALGLDMVLSFTIWGLNIIYIIYRVFQEKTTKISENVPSVKLHRYNQDTYIRRWTVTQIMAS